MCWAHVFRNVTPRLGEVKKNNMEIGNAIMADIEFLQWSATNEATFRKAYTLLEQKYLENDMDDKLHDAVKDFFIYFRKQWVDSPVFRWWEGAHPWCVSNNQGIEGTNRVIKADHTFKRRCPLGNFFDIVDRMVNEWSKRSDDLLFQPRSSMLFEPKGGLKLRTEGYQWAKMNKSGSEKLISINPTNKYTISEAFELGKVDKIWAVNSNSNTIQKPLKERAKERIKQRQNPDHKSFKEFKDVRTSCWLLEERNGEYYCDCPVDMKGKLCQHSNGMAYLQGKLEVTSEVRSVPLGQKRKRGRPKKLPSNCLTRSPIQVQRGDVPPSPVQGEHEESEENAARPEQQADLEPVQPVGPQAVQQADLGHGQQVVQPSGGRPEPAKGRRKRGKTVSTSAMPAEMSAYEQMREENIREREAIFESLNIAEAVNSCKEGLPVKSSRQRGIKRKKPEIVRSPRKLRPRK